MECRVPKTEELPQVIEFLDRHLRPTVNWSIRDEYPCAFAPGNGENIRVVSEGQNILAHAVMRVQIVKTPAGLFKVATLGSVLTHPDYRRQGLSQQIIESCLTSATQQGCDFALLWTDLFSHYERHGFTLAGRELAFTLDRDLGPAIPSHGLFREGPAVSPESLLRLYAEHTVGCLRSIGEVRHHLQIPNSRVFTSWDDTGQLLAYAVEGKGHDLQGYVHEWGGGVSHLIPLFGEMQKRYTEPLTIIVPAHSQNLIRQLAAHGLAPREGFLGMIKILNLDNLLFKVRRQAHNLGLSQVHFQKEGDSLVMGYQSEWIEVTDAADIVRLLFGPVRSRQIPVLSTEAASVFETILPLPMWFWGWDSI